MTLIPFLLLLSIALSFESTSNAKLIISDCGDKSYLLHYKNITATELIRGREAVIKSEPELLTADVTAGNVLFECLRNNVRISPFFHLYLRIFSHNFNYCGYQEASLPLALGKIKYTGSDCSKPRPIQDSFTVSVKLPIITPSVRP